MLYVLIKLVLYLMMLFGVMGLFWTLAMIFEYIFGSGSSRRYRNRNRW
jgi:hypothetical protein